MILVENHAQTIHKYRRHHFDNQIKESRVLTVLMIDCGN